MASHKEFANAGKKPGLQVWRVEKMDLKPVDPESHGSFFTGDSYIVAKTSETFSFLLHSWRGEKASQDEYAAAAILMTQLDDHLGGSAVQFTEYQNKESCTFKGYFKTLKYLKGGVASGFTHTVANEVNVKRLLHVKGRRAIVANEVDMTWDSFNKDDCFIIDLGKDIYHWSGSGCSRYERLKTTEVAKDIRDNERNGRAEVHMIDEGDEPEEVLKLLGPKPDLPASFGDVLHDRRQKTKASLHLISDAGGSMETTLLSKTIPFKQEMLDENECYILDNGVDKLYVWKGPKANKEERKAALKIAEKFIKDKNYPPDTQVIILPAGSESSLFKQFFFNWLDKDETTGPSQAYTIGRIAQVEQIPFDASELHNNSAMAAQHCMVDDGSGEVQIWRVEESDKVPVDPSKFGQFFGGDCYLVLYSYHAGGRKKHIIYIWQGQKCSIDERAASAILTVELDDSMGGVATQVRVPQGKEPPHLVSIFKDKPLVIHRGGTSRDGGQTQPGSTRLYHIRLSSSSATRAVEVEPVASSLNTNDVFVLKTPASGFIWAGKGGIEGEKKTAKYLAQLLEGNFIDVEEADEPEGFWKALGGKKDYQSSLRLQVVVKPPRLFGCSNKTGRLIAEEVPGEPKQIDLAPDDVMILDIWDQIFVWIGKDANETEKGGVGKIADDYVKADPAERDDIPISTIKQGEEPPTFTGWFHAWDPEMWNQS